MLQRSKLSEILYSASNVENQSHKTVSNSKCRHLQLHSMCNKNVLGLTSFNVQDATKDTEYEH